MCLLYRLCCKDVSVGNGYEERGVMCIQKAYVNVKKRISLYHEQYQTILYCTLILITKANQAQIINDTSHTPISLI